MQRHFYFDLDKTLTASRSPMREDHRPLFEHLVNERDVVVVTGGTVEQIREQITPQFDHRYFTLAQSGNEAYAKDGTLLWSEVLDARQLDAIMEFIGKLRGHFAVAVRDEGDIVENRGAQVAYSVLGFHEDIDKKYAFDPDEKRRQAALEHFATDRSALLAIGVEVVPAGTTNFSFIPAGKHKGFNVERLRAFMHWNKDECLYVGDALFPGGNDAVVIGFVPTHAVKDPDDTFRFISSVLS
jgi:phosphomannomutase